MNEIEKSKAPTVKRKGKFIQIDRRVDGSLLGDESIMKLIIGRYQFDTKVILSRSKITPTPRLMEHISNAVANGGP